MLTRVSGASDCAGRENFELRSSLRMFPLFRDLSMKRFRGTHFFAFRPNRQLVFAALAISCAGIYLRAYESVAEARNSIGRYLDFYNGRRPHSSLDGTTPDQAYLTPLPLRLAA